MEKQLSTKKKPMLILVLLLLILSVSAATIANATMLQAVIRGTTSAYVNDVSGQMAQEIRARLQNVATELYMLGGDVAGFEDDEARLRFLAEKLDLSPCSAFGVAQPDGNARFTDGAEEDLRDNVAFQQALQGEDGAFVRTGQYFLYAIPYKKEGSIAGVLLGAIDTARMQALLESDSFGGNGVSCIIDLDCHVVVPPRDMEFFSALDDVFLEQKDAELLDNVARMEEDVKSRRDGSFTFTTSAGHRVLMAYNALSGYDWTLLTIVPSDLISSETDRHLFFTFVIAFFTLAVFVIIIAFMVYYFRQHSRRVERIAYVDPVTGGINYPRFCQLAEKLLRSQPVSSCYMVSLNIRAFKLINEKFGREEGDRTLRYVYGVLQRHLKEGELAARTEADNFFLCMRADGPGALQERLDRILEDINSFDKDFSLPHPLTLQQGACLISNARLSVPTLMDHANIARKNRPEGQDTVCSFYNETVVQKLQQEQDLISLMDPSLENGDFQVYLQPKVRLCDGRLGGAEALIRWQHPQKGVIYPSDFIPLFERTGAICRLDRYVFEQVCSYLRRRLDAGEAIFPISVNLSRQHFRNPDFLAAFEETKTRFQIPDRLIELELTESIIFDGGEISYVKRAIHQMHQAGFLCSLDDFGFGYSSLGLLSEFEVDTIKLDRIFFNGETSRAKWVVEAVVNLSKKLHIETVAEGIESVSQLAFLRQIGCGMVQGYVYSKPLPLEEFDSWAQKNAAGRSVST